MKRIATSRSPGNLPARRICRTPPSSLRPLAWAVASALGASAPAWALPTDPQVVSGQLGVATPTAGRMDLTQGSAKAIVNWRSFGIAGSEAVRLQQPIGGQALFRVTGSDPSQILGQLSSTGHLFLINPRGVLFGPQARVDVGSLTASTLNITDNDFLAGRWRFAGDSRASVVNQGSISAANSGSIVLLGRETINSGSLSAPQGTVALGAGSAATLDVYGNGLLRLNVTAGADGARVEHSGEIAANGGAAWLAARGGASAPAAINLSGIVRAQGLVDRNGAIYLSAGPEGSAAVSGTLDVSGNRGGRIEVTGKSVALEATARLDVSGTAGGGTVRVGGGRHGRETAVPNAAETTVAGGALIEASAVQSGNGGDVVVWADGSTRFDGSIIARGGANGGNGGNAEVSARDSLSMNGTADLSAPRGSFGTLLLDPGSVSIVRSNGAQNGPNSFSDSALISALATANVTVATTAATNNQGETITVNGDANVTWSQATTLTLNAGLSINAFGVIQNTNAGSSAFDAIVLNANQATTPLAGNYTGVRLDGGGRLETARGNIRVNGRGGTTGNFNHGILLPAGSVVRTVNGAINLTGSGGGNATGSSNRGISVESNALIEATGSGSVSLTGTGGVGTTDTGGVVALVNPTLRTASGNLSITGIGGSGTSNFGVIAQGAGTTLASTTGSITVQGTAGPGTERALVFGSGAHTVGGAGTSGAVTLIADRMDLPNLTAATTGTLALRPQSANRAIVIGGNDSATQLGLSIAELANISAGRLEVGSAASGTLTVSQAYTPASGTGTLALLSGGGINVNAALGGGAARVQLTANGNVRLGATVSSATTNVASTRAIHIRSLTGILDNATGAGALSTPNGTWAVSLPTPVGSNFNGLLSGNNAVWSNPVTSNVNPSGNRYSFAIVPTIFVNAGTDTKTYGDTGSTTVALNSAPVSSVANTFGGVFTDYASGTVSGSYTRSSTGLPASAAVGSYATSVSGVAGLTTSLIGYGFAAGNAGTLSVVARPITLAPNDVSRLYGDANPAVGGAAVTSGSLANADVIGSVALSSPATTASNVGSYALSGSNAVFGAGLASNYTITYASNPTGLIVTRRPLIVTPDAVTRVYGDPNPASGTATSNAGGLVNGESVSSVSLSSPATAASNVGRYALLGSNAVFGSGLASNYAITYSSNPTGLNITQRPVTLQGQGTFTWVYGGGPRIIQLLLPTVAGGSLAAGDQMSFAAMSLPTVLVTTPVGAVPVPLTAVGIVNSAALSVTPNYSLTLLPATGQITPRPVTLTPVVLTRAYGDANPATAAVTSNAGFGIGLVNGDTVTGVSLTSPATVTSNVGSYSSSGSNAVFGSGLASNYAISYATNPAGLIVAPRPLTVTPDPVSRVYGDVNPASTSAAADNLVNGDTLASVSLSSPATLTSNVGNYPSTGSNALFGTGLAGNYAVTYATNPAGLNVTPRALTLTPDPLARVYGDVNPASTTASGNNLVNGDTVASVSLSSPATVTSNVGSYATTGSNAVFGTGFASNYRISYVDNPAGLSVTPRPLTLIPDAVSRVYGDVNPASGTGSGDNLVNGDTVASVSLSSPATVTSNVGSYASSGSNAVFGSGLASNYTISYAANPTGLNVTPRALTLAPETTSRVYGNANPASTGATVVAGSLVNGDTVTGLALSSAATPASNVGTYATSGSAALFGSGLASNYSISFDSNPTGLIVTPRPVTLTPNVVSRLYGDPNPNSGTASGRPGGLANGDTIASIVLASPATGTSNVGSYRTSGANAVFGSGLASNYLISYADNPAGLLVTPRPLTLLPNALARVYGDANPVSGAATVSGGTLVNGDALAGIAISTAATPASNVGSYATSGSVAQFSSGLASNYAISYASNPSGLQVSPRPLTLTPDPASRLYGEANPPRGSATANSGGLANGDTVASIALASPAGPASGVGAYDLSGTGAIFGRGSAANYAISYATANGGLSLLPRPLSITALPGQGKFAGSADPLLGFVVSGGALVNGDVLSGALSRAAGEAPGNYAIGLGSLSGGPNYALSFVGSEFVISPSTTVLTIERAPTLGEPSASNANLIALLNTLPPTAAGPRGECVREQVIDRERLGASRLVSRGIRLPEGVVDSCR